MAADPRIDAYIERQADFARPILEHLRRAVHSACPEVEESLKWGMPHFLYKRRMLAGMAAFKAHATFGFRRGKEVLGAVKAERGAIGQFGGSPRSRTCRPTKSFAISSARRWR